MEESKPKEVSSMFRFKSKKLFFVSACPCLSLFSVSVRAQDVPSDHRDVLKLLDPKGDFKAEILKVNVPHSDRQTTVQGVSTPTPLTFRR
jgi:hypothetical protein